MVGGNTSVAGYLKFALLGATLIVMTFPLIWMFRVAFLPPGEAVSILGPLSQSWTLKNFTDLLAGGVILRPFVNSVIVVLVVTAGNCLFCFMAGYAMARYRNLANKFLFVTLLVVLMIPMHITIVPLYLLCHKMGIFDNYGALILPFLVQPIGVFLVKQYVESVPPSMEEAARLDGAGEMTILFRVVMPLCRPALAVLIIQVFFTTWNSFLFPFILTSRTELHTLPVSLAMLQGHQAIDWPHIMAGSAIAVVPVVIVFLLMQRHIISGITAGSIKQ